MFRVYILVAGLAVGITVAWGGIKGPPPDNAQALLEPMRLREQALVEEIRTLRREVAVLKECSSQPANSSSFQESIPGRITEIDPVDNTLVQINLGSEAGLEKHATLEVFRAGAAEEYVGALRIFEVYSGRAVCRLVSTNPLTKSTMQVGDNVRCQHN